MDWGSGEREEARSIGRRENLTGGVLARPSGCRYINNLATEVSKKYDTEKGVFLMADAETPWDQVVQVMSILGEAHIAVNVVTQLADSSRKTK
jgi:hypothetical protein